MACMNCSQLSWAKAPRLLQCQAGHCGPSRQAGPKYPGSRSAAPVQSSRPAPAPDWPLERQALGPLQCHTSHEAPHFSRTRVQSCTNGLGPSPLTQVQCSPRVKLASADSGSRTTRASGPSCKSKHQAGYCATPAGLLLQTID